MSKGITYVYTGGESTQTLTGITPDPLSNMDAGDTIFQDFVIHNSTPTTTATYSNDIIEELNNQIYVGSSANNEVLVSSNIDFTDYSFSSPRISGEGVSLVMPSAIKTIISQENDMYIGSGDAWFRTTFEQITVGSTLAETLNVKQVNSGTGQGAISNSLVAKAKNSIVFISNDNTLEQLGRLENFVTPQFRPLSDPIKPDFIAEDFTNGDIIFFENQIFISAPTSDKQYIYDVEKGFWQAPQILPVGQYAIIEGDLYGHSSRQPETYKLFTGTNDNGISFNSIARFPYLNFNERAKLKNFDEYYVEGYCSANTEILVTFRYDFEGETQLTEHTIDCSDSDILFKTDPTGSLGDTPLGEIELAGSGSNILPKFRTIITTPLADFFELQVEFSTDETDRVWQILGIGGNIRESNNLPTFIKK